MATDGETPRPTERRAQMDAALASFREAQTAQRDSWQADQSQPPRPLYHYTTLGGLRGIIGGQSFWASDVRFMNDASELAYAADLIASAVAEVQTAVTSPQLRGVLPERPGFANAFEYGERPFVACFCKRGDLLSQWRGYRAGEVGYSLGVDFRQIATLGLLPTRTYLRKVVYDVDRQRQLVRTITQTWLEAAEVLLDSEACDLADLFPYPAIWALQEALAEQHLCFKNPAFSEEEEWRLIKLVDVREEFHLLSDRRTEAMLASTRERMKHVGVDMPERPTAWGQARAEGIDIHFRQTALGLVPYVELSLSDKAGIFTDRLPLVEAVHGPSPNAELSLESLSMYLESQGYGVHTTVRTSDVPLRR